MKVKVRRGPGLTGSQKNYGLVTGSIWNYEDKPTSNNVGTTLSPVPRDEATIEAERGETVIGDLDNDGMVEHAKIGGKRHSHGGTPLNVPDGSFVFSDYRGLLIKNKDVLKNIFNMNSSKAVTPAKVAQRYEINKFKNMLNDPFIDPIDRKTAQLMIDNNMRKLGQLALIQEGMKGFPDGIPAIAMPLMGSDMGQQGPQQQMMRKGGVVKYKKGGLSKYQGVEESQVQIPLRPRGAILSPNTDPSIAMPMGNWELLGTDPDLGDVYQNERGEQIANIDGNWSHLMHGPEPVRPSASRDWNNDGYNDELDAAYQQQMMQNVFGDANYQVPTLNDQGTISQTPEYQDPDSWKYYAHEAGDVFTNPGSALMYALTPGDQGRFGTYLQNNTNPVGNALDIFTASQTGFMPFLGAEGAKYLLRNSKDDQRSDNVNTAGMSGWKGAGLGLGALILAAGATSLNKKSPIIYNAIRRRLFPQMFNPKVEQNLYTLNKIFSPGEQKAAQMYMKAGEGAIPETMTGRKFAELQFKDALASGKTKAKNAWQYALETSQKAQPTWRFPGKFKYSTESFPKYLRDRFGYKGLLNVLGTPFRAENSLIRRGSRIGAVLGSGYYLGDKYWPDYSLSDEELKDLKNQASGTSVTTSEDYDKEKYLQWVKSKVPNYDSLPDNAKNKWLETYKKQIANQNTGPIESQTSNAADDYGTTVTETADTTEANKEVKPKVENKKQKVQVTLPAGNSSEEWGKKNFDNWDTLSTASKNQILRQYGRPLIPIKRDGGSILNKFVGGGGSRYYYITPEKRAQIEQKGWDDIQYPSYSTLQNYQDYAPEQVENFRMSSSGMWIPKDYTADEESTLDKATLDWFRNHEAYQNQWQNYSPNGADQWQADMAEFAKMKKPNENWKEAEDRFAEKYGRNPYTWAASTFDKNYFTPKTGLTYFEYDENGNLKPKQEIAGLQFRAIPKLGKKEKKEEKVITETKEDPKQEDPNITPPSWQKAQKRRLPDPRYADILGEIGANLQQIRRYPSVYAPIGNAPIETIYDRFNPQTIMGAYTTALQNAGTGPDSGRQVSDIAGKAMEGVAQGQEQVQTQVNNPRFMNMLAQNQQAKMRADAYNAGEKVRYVDDVATKWQDYLANYNKKIANITEKAATTAENRYKLGLLQSMYPYANLNFDEFTTANPTLASITDEPVVSSQSGTFNNRVKELTSYYKDTMGLSKAEAAKAALDYAKAELAYNKMYSGATTSPFSV